MTRSGECTFRPMWYTRSEDVSEISYQVRDKYRFRESRQRHYIPTQNRQQQQQQRHTHLFIFTRQTL